MPSTSSLGNGENHNLLKIAGIESRSANTWPDAEGLGEALHYPETPGLNRRQPGQTTEGRQGDEDNICFCKQSWRERGLRG